MIERLRSLATALETAWGERFKHPTAMLPFMEEIGYTLVAYHPDPEQGKIAAADLDLLWRELFPERSDKNE